MQELAVLHRSEEPSEPAIRRAVFGSIEFIEEDDRDRAVGRLGSVSKDFTKQRRVGDLGEVHVRQRQLELVEDLLDGERFSASRRPEDRKRQRATRYPPSDIPPDQIMHRVQLVALVVGKEKSSPNRSTPGMAGHGFPYSPLTMASA